MGDVWDTHCLSQMPSGDHKLGANWIRQFPGSSTAVFFLHGILSSGETAWTHPNGASWPALLAEDDEISDLGLDVCVFSYRADWSAETYTISDAADSFNAFMTYDAVWGKPNLIFVCHSMGGILARRFMVAQQLRLKEGAYHVGLFLIASPSIGASDADRFLWLARMLRSSQAEAMRLTETNTWLNDLDRDFLRVKETSGILIVGKELVEDEPIVAKRRIGLRTKVVEPMSAARYFAEPLKIARSDHITIAKPESRSAEQYKVLRGFLREFPSKFAPQRQSFDHSSAATLQRPVQAQLRRAEYPLESITHWQALSPAMRDRFIYALLGLDSINDGSLRERMVQALPPWIRYHVARPVAHETSDDKRAYVDALVERCASYRGSVEALVRAGIFFNGSQQGVVELNEVLTEIGGYVVPLGEVIRLEQHLGRLALEAGKLRRLCIAHAPADAEPPVLSGVSDFHDRCELIEWLATFHNSSDGPSPLLRLTGAVLQDIDDRLDEAWVAAWLARMGASGVAGSNELPVLGSVAIQIDLEPQASERGEEAYAVEAWIFEGGRTRELSGSGTTIRLDQMPQVLAAIVEEVRPTVESANDGLTFEFFLPRKLLNYPVERWCLSDHDSGEPIGNLGRVVVRPGDRLHRLEASFYKSAWTDRWRRLEGHFGEVVPASNLLWCEDPSAATEVRRGLANPEIHCLLVTRPPRPADFDHLLQSVLTSGLAIGAWPHSTLSEDAAVRGELMDWLCEPLGQLPEVAKRARQKSFLDAQTSTANHIALLWDDPTHLPRRKGPMAAPVAP